MPRNLAWFQYYGYIIILAGILVQALCWGIANSFGVFITPLINEFEWSRAMVSGAASLCFLSYGFSSVFLGNLNDRYGPSLIMGICGLLLGAGYYLTSGISSAWQLYVFYGIIAGFGLGCVDVIPLSTVARWFRQKRGMMSGIVKMGTGIGMFVMPVGIVWLMTSAGWRGTFRILAVILLVGIMLLSRLFVRDPAVKGLAVDNVKLPESEGAVTGQDVGLTLGEAFRTRQMWTICTIYFIILFCTYTILVHIVPHAIDLGIQAPKAAALLSTIGGVSIFGRLTMGWACDRIGEKRALLLCLICLLIALTWLQVAHTLPLLYIFSFIQGFAHGGFFALNSPLVAGLFGLRTHGMLLGILILFSTLGGAVGPVMGGMIFDVTQNYRIVFLIMAAACLAAIGLTMTLSPVKDKRLRIAENHPSPSQ